MLFNSLQFVVFFIAITLFFFQLKSQRSRVILLLLASCYFYMSFIPEYLIILGGVIVVDYLAAPMIEKSKGHARKLWLVVSLIANIGVLAVFKYYNFFLDNIATLTHATDLPFLKMALPLGLSFHTFQAMSYTIEVYRGKQKAERDFVVYALYVMFYPQLVAGPIERPQNVLPQLKEFRPYNPENAKQGLSQMMWGFFKKVVIADRLAMIVDYSHSHIGDSSSSVYILGAIMYSFQIYCDFSGYSDIAIGAARVMNIKLMDNFDEPYLSRNIASFWSRWHISLSSWFRDYLYIPLGGNRLGEARRKLNVLIVFLLSGLWHGANWTFVVWGLLHGLLVVLFPGKVHDRHDEKKKTKLVKSAGWIVLNFMLVTILWIFFRSVNLKAAVTYIQILFSFRGGDSYPGVSWLEVALSAVLIGVMMVREHLIPGFKIAGNKKFYLYMVAMIVLCYYLGVFSENKFIYFQF